MVTLLSIKKGNRHLPMNELKRDRNKEEMYAHEKESRVRKECTMQLETSIKNIALGAHY
jgi:hypothetical protein